MALPNLKILEAGECSISYRERGTGDALLFVHGMGCGSVNWETQYEYFSDRYRVIGWDAPGYGKSGTFETDLPSVADYVMLMSEFLNELNIQQVHLVGHSYGAVLVAAFHRAFSDRVLSLTLAQPVVGCGLSKPDAREKEIMERVTLVEDMGMDGFAAFHVPRSCAPGALPKVVKKGIELTSVISKEGYLRQFQSLKHANIYEWTGSTHIPSMIVSGEYDKTASEEVAISIAEAMPGTRHEIIPDIGHMIYLEFPERFNELLDELLKECF